MIKWMYNATREDDLVPVHKERQTMYLPVGCGDAVCST